MILQLFVTYCLLYSRTDRFEVTVTVSNPLGNLTSKLSVFILERVCKPPSINILNKGAKVRLSIKSNKGAKIGLSIKSNKGVKVRLSIKSNKGVKVGLNKLNKGAKVGLPIDSSKGDKIDHQHTQQCKSRQG